MGGGIRRGYRGFFPGLTQPRTAAGSPDLARGFRELSRRGAGWRASAYRPQGGIHGTLTTEPAPRGRSVEQLKELG
jgi:hypothetical protein